jgi:hypothetical protein
MTTSLQTVWYVRKNGWVQGPFTGDLMRRMYAVSCVGAVDLAARDKTGPWREVRTFTELTDGYIADASPAKAGGWEVASSDLPQGAVELGMLQMYAARGILQPHDLVRRLPDGTWQAAGTVEGVFGGRRSWCMACSNPLGANLAACKVCGAAQPGYETSLAAVALVCGLIGFIWHLIALLAITMLAARRATVFGYAMDESFPQAFALTLVGPLWLAIVAVVCGHGALSAVRLGRSSPADADFATKGMILGWATLGVLVLIGVGVVAFSLPYFRVVN